MKRTEILFRTSSSFFGFLSALALTNVHGQGWINTWPTLGPNIPTNWVNTVGCLLFIGLGGLCFLLYWDSECIQKFRELHLNEKSKLDYLLISLTDLIIALSSYAGYIIYLYIATWMGWMVPPT